jgi:hypothetical protein
MQAGEQSPPVTITPQKTPGCHPSKFSSTLLPPPSHKQVWRPKVHSREVASWGRLCGVGHLSSKMAGSDQGYLHPGRPVQQKVPASQACVTHSFSGPWVCGIWGLGLAGLLCLRTHRVPTDRAGTNSKAQCPPPPPPCPRYQKITIKEKNFHK